MKRFFLIIFLVSSIVCADLTFKERLDAMKRIEKIYYNNRIWPKENPNPKPPFEEVIKEEILKKKVEDTLKKSILLGKIWQRPIEGEQLQAEIERIIKSTKDPETLKEIFKALGNDPYLIAETLARETLVDRLIRNWYSYDERFHGELKKEAENLRENLTIDNFEFLGGERFQKVRIKKNKGNLKEEKGFLYLDEEEFKEFSSKYPEENGISEVEETREGFIIKATFKRYEDEIEGGVIVFKKESFDEWFSKQEVDINEFEEPRYEYKLIEIKNNEKFENGQCEVWEKLWYMPDSRYWHTAVWTGTEMIIWGGTHGDLIGGKYNPSTDTWTPTSMTNAPSTRACHTAVWTGSEMIIWGGLSGDFLNSGGRYNPSTDTWTPTSTTNAPSARHYHTAVWTGSVMIVWGGYGGSYFNSGGRYNPSTDSWTATSTTNAPSARQYHTAVWTGSEMIVWGGAGGLGIYLNTGGRYNPSTDSWTATSTTNAPSARSYHTAVWTGSEMIIWGGDDYYDYFNTGGRYNPSTNSWTATSTTNAPSARQGHSAVWTGSEMIVWGGYDGSYFNTGGRYNPSSNSWTATTTTNTPSGRSNHTAVWTGDSMIVWDGDPPTLSGGLYKIIYPKTFNNLSPLNNAVNQSTYNLLIDWDDSADANYYDLYFGTTNPPSLYQSNLTSSSYTVNGLGYSTTYYWYVVAKNDCGSKAGTTWNFTTASKPRVIPDGSSGTNPLTAIKNDFEGTQLQVSWDNVCSPIRTNIIYGYLSQVSSYQITGSKCNISNPDVWDIGSTTNIWFVIVSDNGAGVESSWGMSSSGQRNGTNPSNQCGNSIRDNSGTCP